MSQDTATLATRVVSSVLLPAVDPSTGQSSNLAGQIWSRLESVFTASQEQYTLEQFQKNPYDSQSLLIKLLEQKLTTNQQLAWELSELLRTRQSGAVADDATYARHADTATSKGLHLSSSTSSTPVETAAPSAPVASMPPTYQPKEPDYTIQGEVETFRKQLVQAEQNLRLIQQRKSQYATEEAIPSQLLQQEQKLTERITRLKARITEYGA